MLRTKQDSSTFANGTVTQLLAKAAQFQAMEGNPVKAEEIDMFEIFEPDG